MVTPKISVIFPVGNREAFLREAIESILTQTFSDFELLVVLDGVSDAVEEIINSYHDVRIRVVGLPVNLGISTARNVALRIVQAPLIALMDSDDVAMSERFERQFDWMRIHSDVTVCATNSIKLLMDGQRLPMRYPESDGVIKARLLYVDSAMLNPTTMFRTDFVRRHALQYDANFPRDHDHRFFVEMMRKGATFYGLQEELLLYRRHGNNVTINQTGKDEEKSLVREIVLPLFFPDLTGEAYRVLLKGMCEKVQMNIDEGCQFVTHVNRAIRETRSFVGEDRQELQRLLSFYRDRILRSLGSAAP